METIKVLGAARLSRDTDESTSIPRQRTTVTSWADFRTQSTGTPHEVITITEDTDVSGAVSPFAREGLGPYLRKPLLDTWSVLVVSKLDRLTRSIRDFERLWVFFETEGKTLVSVAENIDFGTPTGRLLARQLVIFAEFEREQIKARVKDAYDTIIASGGYAGNQFPFGYIPVKLGKGWGLEPHPEYAATVRAIVAMLIEGKSLHEICRSLDAEGIPTPRNAVREYGNALREREGKEPKPIPAARWKTTSLTKLLRSPNIVGEVVSNGKPLRDKSGYAIQRAEPLITREQWAEVKSILDANAARMGPRVNSSPLLQVAFCARCKSPLYISRSGTYRYYGCVSCPARKIPADKLEQELESRLMARAGHLPLTETHVIEASDTSAEVARLAEAIGALASQIELGKAMDQDVSAVEEEQEVNRRNLAKLVKVPSQPAREVVEVTGETWAERWERMTWPERNTFLREREVKLWAVKQDGKIRVTLDITAYSLKLARLHGEGAW
jgi:site-specific DNA recombinase